MEVSFNVHFFLKYSTEQNAKQKAGLFHYTRIWTSRNCYVKGIYHEREYSYLIKIKRWQFRFLNLFQETGDGVFSVILTTDNISKFILGRQIIWIYFSTEMNYHRRAVEILLSEPDYEDILGFNDRDILVTIMYHT